MASSDGARGLSFAARVQLVSVLGVVGILALALAVLGWATPSTSTTSSAVAYTQSGEFSYHADAAAGSIYGAAGLKSGQPILTGEVKKVTFTFAHHLTSDAPVNVRGSQSMVVVIDFGAGLTREISLARVTDFADDGGRMTGTLDVASVKAIVDSARAAGLATIAGPTVAIAPRISASGTVAGEAVKTSFTPQLVFDYSGTALTPHAGGTGSDDGSGATRPSSPLTPATNGTVDVARSESATLPLVVVHPAVTQARIGGLAVAIVLLGAALLLGRPLLSHDGDVNDPERIRDRYGASMVDIATIDIPDAAVVDVVSMAELADVAREYESVIMHLHDAEEDTYLVWDNGLLYRFMVTSRRPGGWPASVIASNGHAPGVAGPSLDPSRHETGAAVVRPRRAEMRQRSRRARRD